MAVDDGAKFKAYGLPIILMIFLPVWLVLATIVISKRGVSNAWETFPAAVLFFGGLVNVIIAIFLFWTPGWNFAIALALFSIAVMGCVVCGVRKHLAALFILMALWVASIAGHPQLLGPGPRSIMGCFSYYFTFETRADMCRDGWTTFSLIIAIVAVGITGLMILALLNVAVKYAVEEMAAAASSTVAPSRVVINVPPPVMPPAQHEPYDPHPTQMQPRVAPVNPPAGGVATHTTTTTTATTVQSTVPAV